MCALFIWSLPKSKVCLSIIFKEHGNQNIVERAQTLYKIKLRIEIGNMLKSKETTSRPKI